MNEIITQNDRAVIARPETLLDKATFQQIAEIAAMMASASLIPESLSHEGTGDRKKALPMETVRANCFLVANQAIKWGADPFAVAQCCSVVHGRLMFEGKLVAAVIESTLGFKLVHAYGKWDRAKECCIVGEDASGDDLAIRIGEGHFENGVAVFGNRFIDGNVGSWKTTGNNSPWRPGRNRSMLIYRGTREFARIFEPGVMLGVITEDEYDPAFNAKDVTPAQPATSAGGSVIDRLKQSQTNSTAGFDRDRVKNDIDAASQQQRQETDGEKTTSSSDAVDEENPASSTADTETQETSQENDGAADGAGDAEGDKPADVDEMGWLFNVGAMLWAATTFNGGPDVAKLLKTQRKVAAETYSADGVSDAVRKKATSVFDRCMSVINGDTEPGDALAIISGIIGREERDIDARAKGGAA